MQIGYVKRLEIAVKEGNETVKKKYYEMSIAPLFGNSQNFTLSRSKSENVNAPYFNIYAHNQKGWIKRKMKVGSLWLAKTDDGIDFMSGYIETPVVFGGRMNISLWKAKPNYEGEEVNWEYDVRWKPYDPNKETKETKAAPSVPVIEVDADDEEIPF